MYITTLLSSLEILLYIVKTDPIMSFSHGIELLCAHLENNIKVYKNAILITMNTRA